MIGKVEDVSAKNQIQFLAEAELALQRCVPTRQAGTGDDVARLVARYAESALGIVENRRGGKSAGIEPAAYVALAAWQVGIGDQVRPVGSIRLSSTHGGGQDRRQRLAALQRNDAGNLPIAQKMLRSSRFQPPALCSQR